MDKKKNERIFQAVMIADSLKNSFEIFERSCPTILMPCLNIPMLRYTVEFLISNSITELFIFAHSNQKEILEFINTNKSLGIKIYLRKCESKPSVTSAIKELDTKDLIKGDLLFVNGHVLSNIKISKAIEEHQKRRSLDVPMLMTKLFIKCPIDSKRRCQSDLISLVINENTQELLKYQSMEKEVKCKINDNFEFKQNKHSHLYVTMGLIDCDIDIVGQNIISILEDFSHFDEFKDEFINHVTKSEIISDKIYIHEVEGDNYFLRVSNPQLYYQSFIDGVQRHIISDESVKFNAESFILHDCFAISSEDSVDFKSINESNGSVCIGSSTAVAENTIIDNTCIGKECKISENCRITESIIWDKVTIGAGSEIYNCIITQGIVIPPGSHFKNVLLLNTGDQEHKFTEHAIEISKFKKIPDGNESDESDLLDEESDEDDNKNSNNSFLDEIKAIINRQISEEHSLDAIKVEINTVRFSDNKTLTECCGAVITALIDYVMIQSDQTIQSSIKSIEKLFNQYSGMLKSFVTTKSDQASLIENIEKSCIDHSTLTSGFHLLLQILWKSKLLTSESVIDWYQTEIEDAHELRTKFLNCSKKFVEYLKSQEEDSGEEEEDEEENE